MARRSAASKPSNRTATDTTMRGGDGGRGGRARGTAVRKSAAESTGRVEISGGTASRAQGSPQGKGSKPDAPRGRKGQTSGRGSTGARKSANRPGAAGTGSKKGIKGASGRRRSGSRSGAGQGLRKKR